MNLKDFVVTAESNIPVLEDNRLELHSNDHIAILEGKGVARLLSVRLVAGPIHLPICEFPPTSLILLPNTRKIIKLYENQVPFSGDWNIEVTDEGDLSTGSTTVPDNVKKAIQVIADSIVISDEYKEALKTLSDWLKEIHA